MGLIKETNNRLKALGVALACITVLGASGAVFSDNINDLLGGESSNVISSPMEELSTADSSDSDYRSPVYNGLSTNRTVLTYNLTEENLFVKIPARMDVERVVYSDVGEKYDLDYLDEYNETINSIPYFFLRFDSPGEKQVEIFGATELAVRLCDSDDRLVSVEIGEGVEKIGNTAFYDCSSLKTVKFPENSLKTIEYDAFHDCTVLTGVNIPDSVTTLGKNCFRYCYGLSEIIIGEGVTTIPEYAFYACKNVLYLSIGQNVTTLETYCFAGLGGISAITIPDSVTTIGESAFRNCPGVQYLTLGKGVKTIDNEAFYNNTGLLLIRSYASNPPIMGTDVFKTSSKLQSILVPDANSISLYENADGWSNFTGRYKLFSSLL